MKKYPLAALLSCASLAAIACDDSEYGCTVALCVANPGGPTEFVQCQSCVDRLRADLRHGKGWPSCEKVAFGSDTWERCAMVYKNHKQDIQGGAWCGRTTDIDKFAKLGAAPLPAIEPGRRKAKPNYEDVTNADGTKTRYWFN